MSGPDPFAASAAALGERVRILLSARDVAATYHVAELGRMLAGLRSVEQTILASEPALSILAAAGLAPRAVTGGPAAAEQVRRALADFRPHVALVSQTGAADGVDNAVLDLVERSRAYMVQDFPGSLPDSQDMHAGTCFVRDATAAALVRERFDGAVVEIGSLTAWRHAGVDVDAARTAGRRAHGDDARLVGFYGQPLWELAGYPRTLRAFANALRGRQTADGGGIGLFYRPHPEETPEQTRQALQILSAAYPGARRDPVEVFVESAAAADVMVTCTSSSADDRAALQAHASAPLGTTLCLLFEADVRDGLVRDTGSDVPPPVAAGTAGCVTAVASLPAALESAFDEEVAGAQWRAAATLAMPGRNPLKTILDTVASDLSRFFVGGSSVSTV